MSSDSPQNPDAVILRTENLGRSVPDKVLVSGVSFEVRKGETLAIVGPSGSGKSSLLRLLNRLDEPTEGTVYFDGVDYRQIEPRRLRQQVGMVMQRPYLFAGSVIDNLRFGPRQRGEDLSTDAAEQLLAGVGLGEYGSRDIANLSEAKPSGWHLRGRSPIPPRSSFSMSRHRRSMRRQNAMWKHSSSGSATNREFLVSW
jgi:ABC-type transport system involved in cytochrome bd biosynthesis fused ATPase/permease subunit